MPINTTYQFVTAGDYVNFYVNNNLQFKLSKDSNIIAWYFDDTPGLSFKINGGSYFAGTPEDISFDGVPLGSNDGFVTAIKAMFPVYAGGAGSTPGIDDVLAEGQVLTADRTINAGIRAFNVKGRHVNLGDINDEHEGTKIIIDDEAKTIHYTQPQNGVHIFTGGIRKNAGYPIFADNAAALSGGLIGGDHYSTASGVVMCVID